MRNIKEKVEQILTATPATKKPTFTGKKLKRPTKPKEALLCVVSGVAMRIGCCFLMPRSIMK